MPKNDNSHALRFLASMEKHNRQAEAETFAQSHPLSQSATAEKKFTWAESQCAFLAEQFDDAETIAIRMDCACGPEYGKGNKLRTLYEKAGNYSAFAEQATALNLGFSVEYDGQYLYLVYPQCYCSCVKRIEKPLPKTWCYCTLGYAKRMFEDILGKEVRVQLVGSIKQGDDRCTIRILP